MINLENKKKIAIVTGSLVTGGAEAMVAELATKLNKEKYEIKVICIYISVKSPIEKMLEKSGVNVIFLNKTDGVNLNTFFKLKKILKEFNPDVVHTHLSGAIYSYPWVILSKYKMVHTLHTSPEKEFSRMTQKLFKLLYMFNKAKLVTVSPENKIKAAKHYSLNSKKIEMVFNPVDIKRFERSVDNEKQIDLNFINVGRQDQNKNQEIIIKAFNEITKKYKNTKLFLVGDGEKNNHLKSLSEEFNLENKIIFTGIIENPESYLKKSDIYIQSSNYEGLPLSVLEAMASGLAIVSTNVGGLKDIVSNNGVLVEANNLKELITAMDLLVSNKNILDEMKFNSKKNIKKFDSLIMANNYSKIYDSLLS